MARVRTPEGDFLVLWSDKDGGKATDGIWTPWDPSFTRLQRWAENPLFVLRNEVQPIPGTGFVVWREHHDVHFALATDSMRRRKVTDTVLAYNAMREQLRRGLVPELIRDKSELVGI